MFSVRMKEKCNGEMTYVGSLPWSCSACPLLVLNPSTKLRVW
jgi:hypothetical protein